MATIQLELHQSIDGTSFSSREEANQHNDNLSQNAYDNIEKMLRKHCKLSSYDLGDVLDMFIDQREELLKQLFFLI